MTREVSPTIDELVYKWPGYSFKEGKELYCLSTDLRDGLQQPGIHQPTFNESIFILQGNLALGVHDIELGFPANDSQRERAVALASYTRREVLPIQASCLARTIESDIDSIVQVADALGEPVEVILILGSSKIRQLVQNWSLSQMEDWTRECVNHAIQRGLSVNYLTEDGTRSEPDTLKLLYTAAIEEGAQRVTLADTVGVANPPMIRRITELFQEIINRSNPAVGMDFHPHNDKRLAVANALTALEAGAERIHTTLHGVGERAGNVDLFALLTEAQENGIYEHDLSKMMEIAKLSAQIFGISIGPNQPVVGRNAHATMTGMHADAIKKAQDMGRPDLASLVYAPYPAELVGQEIRIDVGALSGRANIMVALQRIGVEATENSIVAIERLIQKNGGVLEDNEITLYLNQTGLVK